MKLLIQVGADVTIINKAGHDAVFEAEINDKKEVVEWLLGAVEDLERGVGQTNEATGELGEAGSMNVDTETIQGSSNGLNSQGAAGVEDVRRRMEEMQTKDGSSLGG